MAAHPLRVNAAELLRRPGSEKDVELRATVAEIGLVDERFWDADPVSIQLRLESLTDGIVVNGEVDATWHGVCRRCALPAEGDLHSDVHELYQYVVTDPEAFELVGDVLDLEPMVREVLVLDAPASPLCRPDCAGLCPVCGIDRNTDTCSCQEAPVDSRWGALDALRQQGGPGDSIR
jgi:uncharacterized protein